MSDKNSLKSGGKSLPGFLTFETMTKRADFLRAARGKRVHSKSFVLQCYARHDEAPGRVGFTCSKKVGNAVARNRAKRRLREVARLGLPSLGKSGYDYVLIGRANLTASTEFTEMQREFETALKTLHPGK
ncbi:MAG: ribonuclease P protein component [Planktomarina sp.]